MGKRITPTKELACAAGQDAGNRAMRRAGRRAWSLDDYNAAAERTVRMMIFGEILPPDVYAEHGFGGFPFVMGNDGSWIAPQSLGALAHKKLWRAHDR